MIPRDRAKPFLQFSYPLLLPDPDWGMHPKSGIGDHPGAFYLPSIEEIGHFQNQPEDDGIALEVEFRALKLHEIHANHLLLG